MILRFKHIIEDILSLEPSERDAGITIKYKVKRKNKEITIHAKSITYFTPYDTNFIIALKDSNLVHTIYYKEVYELVIE